VWLFLLDRGSAIVISGLNRKDENPPLREIGFAPIFFRKRYNGDKILP
jgi:hypothetical protein